MTGKRFSLFEDLDIKDNATGRIIPPCLDRGLSELVDLLNQLNDENEQLRHDATILIQSNQDYRRENEQLKKQMNRLYNYFVDWHGDIMGANQFSEMWDDVKEDEDWEY